MIQSHHLPTCDDVFELLTRAPFPTGEHAVDFPVERHLTVCHSCRELAEALRPVTAVLAEGQAEPTPEETPLPAFLAECKPMPACGPSVQLERKGTGIWQKRTGAIIGFAACLALVITAGGSWLASGPSSSPSSNQMLGTQFMGQRSGGSHQPPTTHTIPHIADSILPVPSCSLLAFEPPSRRVTPAAADVKAEGSPASPSAERLLAQELSDQQCCSQCHHAGGGASQGSPQSVSLKGPQMLALVNHCKVCHAQ